MHNLIVPIVACFLLLCDCANPPSTEHLHKETIADLFQNPHGIHLNEQRKNSLNEVFEVLNFGKPDSILLWRHQEENWNGKNASEFYDRVERYEDSCYKSIIILKNKEVERVVIIRPPVFYSFFDISAGKCEQIDTNKILLSEDVYAMSGDRKSVYPDTYVKSDSAILNLGDSSITFFEGYEIGPMRGMYAQTFDEGKLIWNPNCHWYCSPEEVAQRKRKRSE